MTTRTSFTDDEIAIFAPSEKIGLVACINPEGHPHIALITSLMAAGPARLTLGQFCTGLSKWFMQLNPKVGFLIMSLDRRLWRGTARWTHKRTEGPEYEVYNNQPMFRYNSYFGINTVHYLDLLETSGPEKLPMGGIIPAALLTRMARGAAVDAGGAVGAGGAVNDARGTGIGAAGAVRFAEGAAAPAEGVVVDATPDAADRRRILKPFAQSLFNRFDTLKFLSCIGEDGFARITPVIQCQAADSRRLVFATFPYRDELRNIAAGKSLAVFALNLKMQSVLVRGIFRGFRRHRGAELGVLDIDWVYNSMPPNHGQIYPESRLEAVRDFS